MENNYLGVSISDSMINFTGEKTNFRCEQHNVFHENYQRYGFYYTNDADSISKDNCVAIWKLTEQRLSPGSLPQ